MEKWIQNLVKKNSALCLNDLILPGTHNSSCFRVETDELFTNDGERNTWFLKCWPASSIVKKWTINQNNDMYDQLLAGVRIFDLDVSYNNKTNKFYSSHRFAISPIEYCLKKLNTYSNMYNEPFIIKIVTRYGMDQESKDDFARMLFQYFGNKMIQPGDFLEPLTTPIKNFIEKKKNIIIYFNHHSFYNLNQIWSSWANKHNTEQCILSCQNTFDEYIKNKKNLQNIFMDLNWTMTQNASVIIKGCLLCWGYYDLQSWQKDFIESLVDFIKKNKKNIKMLNSISTDFAIDTGTVKEIVSLNF